MNMALQFLIESITRLILIGFILFFWGLLNLTDIFCFQIMLEALCLRLFFRIFDKSFYWQTNQSTDR